MQVYCYLYCGRSFENTGTYSDSLITVKIALTEWAVEYEYAQNLGYWWASTVVKSICSYLEIPHCLCFGGRKYKFT